MLEKDIEKMLIEYLLAKGYFVWKNQSQGTYDPTKKTFRRTGKYCIGGVSDILGILPNGKFLAIEVKTHKTRNRASEKQKKFIENIRANGGIAGVAWDINSLEAILSTLNYD